MFQSKICRVCEKSTHLIDISHPLNQNYVKQYLACADVSYEANDGLPTYLCRLCAKKLQNAYNFKQKCEETQLKLKILLSKVHMKSEHLQNSDLDVKPETPQDNTSFAFDGPTTLNDYSDVKSEISQDNTSFSFDVPITLNNDTTLNVDSKLIDTNSSNSILPEKKLILFCDICQMKFYLMNTLEKHMRNNHGMKENTRTCIKCSKALKSHRYYEIHKCVPESCNYCGKKFVMKNLSRHIKSVHLRILPYICDICGKLFSQKNLLKSHIMARHTKDYKYSCSICNEKFTLKHLAKEHEKLHLPKDKRVKQLPKIVRNDIICEICGKKFNSKQYLFIHKRVHTGEQPYECDICNRRFQINENLKRHKLIHTDIKPHKCDICQRRFRAPFNLKKHKLTHTDIKPHNCNICDKSFRTLFILQRHTLIHTGEKPYKCNYCEKSFTQQGSLKAHIRTHNR